jgi:hypothetical protein
VLLCGLALSSTIPNRMGLKARSKVYQEPFPQVMNFTSGLIAGLEADANSPGACAKDLTGAEGNVVDLYSAVSSFIGGNQAALFEILTSGEALIKAVEGSSSDCDFSTLVTFFESLSTSAGRDKALTNIIGNLGGLTEDAKALTTCSANVYTCGFTIGNMFKLLTGWSVTMEYGYVSASDFIQGFVSGVEVPGSNGACITDVNGMEPLFEDIYNNAVAVIGGNYLDILSLVGEVKTAWDDIEGFDGDCNVNGLITVIESLGTLQGWETVAENFMANFGTISTAAPAFLSCPSAPQQCGYSLGEILRLTLGWGLGPNTSAAPKRVRDSNVTAWVQAFINGLETDPSSNNICGTDLLSLSSNFESLYQDIISLSQGNVAAGIALYADAKQLWSKLQAFSSPCNLPELESILEGITTPQGIMSIVGNVSRNWSTISADLKTIQACSVDAAACGTACGSLVQETLGWGI